MCYSVMGSCMAIVAVTSLVMRFLAEKPAKIETAAPTEE